jgi:hypothetical protein
LVYLSYWDLHLFLFQILSKSNAKVEISRQAKNSEIELDTNN